MAASGAQLFADNSILNLRDVVLSRSDTPQTFREKLARVILDEMYQFVGLLDVNGMTLEIDRAALEGAGTRLTDIQGRPFWDARWWQVCSETRGRMSCSPLPGKPGYGWLRPPSRLKMNSLALGLDGRLASQRLPDIRAKENIRHELIQAKYLLTSTGFLMEGQVTHRATAHPDGGQFTSWDYA